MLTVEIVKNMVLALLLGSLIGLQREHSRKHDNKPRFAGIRTFMLTSLLGAIGVYISREISPYLFIAIFVGYLIFVMVAYFIESSSSKDIGATTELANVISFLCGAFCALGEIYLAVFIAVVTTGILALKGKLHRFASSVHENEIYSTVKFAVLAFIILPLLPNRGFGPYEVFNQFLIMLMIVLISGMSFGAYILIKALGPKKGLGAMGMLGGFISSTAITTSLASQSKKSGAVNVFVFGIVVAGSMMIVRVLIALFVLNRELVTPLLFPLALMALTGFGFSLWFWTRKEDANDVAQSVSISSPFTLSPALKFGAIFAAVLFLTKAGQAYMGDRAIYVISLLSGLLDVDAIVVSMANLMKSAQVMQETAVLAILIAIAANTLFKAGVTGVMGSRDVARKVTSIFLVMLLAGFLAAVLF